MLNAEVQTKRLELFQSLLLRMGPPYGKAKKSISGRWIGEDLAANNDSMDKPWWITIVQFSFLYAWCSYFRPLSFNAVYWITTLFSNIPFLLEYTYVFQCVYRNILGTLAEGTLNYFSEWVSLQMATYSHCTSTSINCQRWLVPRFWRHLI